MQQELLTIDEFCKLTRTGKTKVWAEIGAGRLKALRYGRCVRITREAMNEWIASLPDFHADSAKDFPTEKAKA